MPISTRYLFCSAFPSRFSAYNFILLLKAVLIGIESGGLAVLGAVVLIPIYLAGQNAQGIMLAAVSHSFTCTPRTDPGRMVDVPIDRPSLPSYRSCHTPGSYPVGIWCLTTPKRHDPDDKGDHPEHCNHAHFIAHISLLDWRFHV